MKVPRTIWLPVSRMKLRTSRGPNWLDASESDAIVIEKVREATVIMEPAIVAMSVRAPSALPALPKAPLPGPSHLRASSRLSVPSESRSAATDIRAGKNQKDSRTPPSRFSSCCFKARLA